MEEIELNWQDFKNKLESKNGAIQYIIDDSKYYIWFNDSSNKYFTRIYIENPAITGSDQEDFELNYKDSSNKAEAPKSKTNKPYMIASSKPDNTSTSFTSEGDDIVNKLIGGGQSTWWDFSNTDNDITAPTGFKRKKIELEFIDPIWIKEGSFYYNNVLKGSYIDVYIVCPVGLSYKDSSGNLVTATQDTVIYHYVRKHYIFGTCNFGDRLNTEESQDEPTISGYKLVLEITVPDTDVSSYGYCEVEMYRERTVLL